MDLRIGKCDPFHGGGMDIFWNQTMSLESVRFVRCYKVHKRPKTAVASEISFLLAKL